MAKMRFRIKLLLAYICDKFGISDLLFNRLGKRLKNRYIRIINYHNTTIENLENFKRQVEFFKRFYKNVSYDEFERFLTSGELTGDMPGIMLTFDDGLIGNYTCAYKVLQEYGMTGYFMVSSELVGSRRYMTYSQLRELKDVGHIIGGHTSTHHRMNLEDTKETLEYEILQSKKVLEKEVGTDINIFCWCGGEESHYTKAAADMIKSSGYIYGFMTNSFPVTKNNDSFQIQRTNVEENWPIYLVKFQVCGFMDWRFRKKRKRVNDLLR
ncbi:MAG: polysaccharide deacetylase family protein [Turicibacter sp.]|nr:polysaccharide deacetylase family protein [Turicibacter sp.]